MSLIITATDFSDVADTAVNYACQMAADHKAAVTIIYTYIVPVAFSDTPIPVMPVDEEREMAEERMQGYIKELQTLYPGVVITSNVMYGELVDCLLEYAEQKKPWIIILGNSDQYNAGLWAGNAILNALRSLSCPVVVIPGNVVYKPVKKICLACDLHGITEKFPSEQLLDLVLQTQAALHVLNIGNDTDVKEATIMDTERLHMYLSPLQPQYHFVESADPDAAINSFVENNSMDWLVVLPHKHSFFESLFHKSHTKAMTEISHTPLVALHEKE